MPDISKIKAPDNTVYNLLSKKTKGVIRCETDSTSTATAFKVTVSGITELYDGLTLLIKNTAVASASGCTLQVNDLAAKRIVRSNGGGYVTTHWALNSTYLFVYNATNTRWEMQQGYWADNNTWRGIKVDGTRILGTGISTGDINFISGSNVTLTGSGNDLTISASGEGSEQVSYGTDVPLSSEGSDKDLYFKVSATSSTATVDIRVVHAEMDARSITLTITHGSNTLYTSTPTTNVYAVYNTVSDTFLGDDGTSHTITHYGTRTYASGEVCNTISIDGGTAIELLCDQPNSSYPWDLSAQTQISYIGGYDTVENGYLKAGDDWIKVTPDTLKATDGENTCYLTAAVGSGGQPYVETNGNLSADDIHGTQGYFKDVLYCGTTSKSGLYCYGDARIYNGNTILKNTTIDVTEADNDVSETTYTRLIFTDKNNTISTNGISAVSSAAHTNGRTSTYLNCRNYATSTIEAVNNYLRLYADKDGTAGVGLSHPAAWLSALGIVNSSITLSPETGATVQTGGAYQFGPIVIFNVVLKLTKSFANGDAICSIPTQLTESRFMAYTGTDAWFAGKAMMPCRFHGSALKPIGATPTASSTNPIYLYVNQTYITSAS